jgi:hypothetical protein
MAIKYTKWLQTIPTSSITRPSKIFPNWDFGLKIKVTSGNPDLAARAFVTFALSVCKLSFVEISVVVLDGVFTQSDRY